MTTYLNLPDPRQVYLVNVLSAHFLRGLILQREVYNPALALHFFVEIVGTELHGYKFDFGVTTHGTWNHTARYRMALNALEMPYTLPGSLDTEGLAGRRFYVRISHAYDPKRGLNIMVDEMYLQVFHSSKLAE